MKGIYKITNFINNKVYIGQSINIEKRWKSEKKLRRIGSHLYNAFKKYGVENFSFEIIEECDNLTEREKFWILFYHSYDRAKGYNLTLGGDGWSNLTQEQYEYACSINKGKSWGSHSEKTKKILSEQKKGISKTEEHKKKLSENHHLRQPIICIETNETFNSIIEASKKLNISASSIGRNLRGITKNTKSNFTFAYVGKK